MQEIEWGEGRYGVGLGGSGRKKNPMLQNIFLVAPPPHLRQDTSSEASGFLDPAGKKFTGTKTDNLPSSPRNLPEDRTQGGGLVGQKQNYLGRGWPKVGSTRGHQGRGRSRQRFSENPAQP